MISPFFITIQGIRILVESESTTISEWLHFDFALSISEETNVPADITVKIIARPASDAPIPPIPETSHSPEYVTYTEQGTRFIDYYGRVVAVYTESTETASFYSTEDHFLYEKVYLFILSRLGELLDYRAIHRIHSLGFTYRDKGVLYLIPMRGGKSTLAISLLSMPECTLLSDDAPFINHSGELIPFPFRLGVREGEPLPEALAAHTRVFKRKGRDAKVLIDPRAVTRWQRTQVRCDFIYVGRWTKSPNPNLKELSALRLWYTLFRDCVIGLGLPQVVEFFLKSTITDLFKKIWIAILRTTAITKLCLRSRGYEFHVTNDIDKNRSYLIEHIERMTDG